MRIADCTRGRDNNFNLIRLLAALAVLVSHGFILALGAGEFDPLFQVVGVQSGRLAVDVFFVTSGFLVTQSLLKRRNALSYVWSRALRIFPALVVMLVLTVVVIGPVSTTEGLASYFASTETFRYLIGNAALLFGLEYDLPGVFEKNPVAGVVNGSLWTLPFELKFYVALLLAWWASRRIAPGGRLFRVVIVVIAGISLLGYVADTLFITAHRAGPQLAFHFFTGAAFFLYRERIVLSWPAFLIAITALVGAAVLDDAFALVYPLCLAYVVCYLAFIPDGRLRRFNAWGDWSYGVYVYAFPVQQLLCHFVPGIEPGALIASSASITLPLAFLSWRWIEQPALSMKPAAPPRDALETRPLPT